MATTTGGSSAQFGYGVLLAQGIASTISAFGSLGISKHNNAIAQSQANIARINAQMMERQYESTLRSAERAIVQKTMAAGQTKASQRSALAANGIAVGEGSAAELQASTDIIKEMDVNQIKANATSQAWGYKTQAVNYESQALMSESQKQGKWGAFGVTLLGGASQVANSYGLMAANGVFDTNSGGEWAYPDIRSGYKKTMISGY